MKINIMYIVNDRYYWPQSQHSRCPLYLAKPRFTLTASPDTEAVHYAHKPSVGRLSRSRVSDCLQACGPARRLKPYANGPGSYDCTVRGSLARHAADDTTIVRRSVYVRADKRCVDSGARTCIFGTVCVPEKDFSQLLLDMKYLVLGPGGMGYFGHVGYLQMLSDNDKLKNIEEISGASAGALVAFMYAICKGNTKEIFNESMSSNISDTTKIKLSSFFNEFGFIPQENIKSELRRIAKKICGNSDPNFEDLFKIFPVKLHIAAFCLTDCKTEYFSTESHPTMSVIDAVCASISVPFLFSAVSIENKIYIDGGIEESVPYTPFMCKNSDDVVAVKIMSKTTGRDEIKDLKGYAGRLVHFILKNRVKYKNIKTLMIDLTNYDIFDFKLSDKTKLELFIKGYLIS